MQMKTIVYRGGVLLFRVPEAWVEEYSDTDGGTFYDSGPDTGTLRVTVITISRPVGAGGVSRDGLVEQLLRQSGRASMDVKHVGDNAFVRYDEPGVERGMRLRIFYWVFANPLPPEHGRMVTFSYTVLESQVGSAALQRELEMLEEEIVRTEFALEMGV